MPLEPGLAAMIKIIESQPALDSLSAQQARAQVDAGRAALPPGPPLPAVQNRSIDTPAGQLSVRVYKPVARPIGLLAYFHAGGWVLGNLDSPDAHLRQFALQTQCCIVSCDYRKAPEHRFPAAVDDARAALMWVSEHCEELAGALVPIIVAGESAGGNLAAVVSILARDAGGPAIAGQMLLYPVTDADFETTSYVDNAEGYYLTRSLMRWFWDHYAPDAASRTDFRASPLRATDLSRLPPALIQTAEFDPLRDEGEAYGERLRAAGTPAVVQRRAGVIHGFLGMGTFSPGSQAAFDDAAAWVRCIVQKK